MAAISVYLPADLKQRVDRVASAEGRSSSGWIIEAVRIRLARLGGQSNDPLERALMRLDRRLDKSVRDGAVVKEALLLFVRVWLEYNPPIDENIRDSAARSAAARFERYIDRLAIAIDSGRSLAPTALSSESSSLEEAQG